MPLTFPHTVNHHKKRTRRGGSGEFISGSGEELVSQQTGVTAWVQKPSAKEMQMFDKDDAEIARVVYYETEPSIDESFVIEFDGDYLEPISKPVDATAGLEQYWKVRALERTARWSTG